ncbi:hypothetical protein [Bradyrhizobium sp. HKCCYLRH3061]|uniref:hypothetical protein n=1 Tax=Bradyrhizobium sp. HKCCYLRH3061 TaxID=3420734 RepID=UPI003EBCFEB7
MCDNSCNCAGSKQPSRTNMEAIGALKKQAETKFQSKLAASDVRVSLLDARGNPALEILSDNPSDKRSLLIFQRLGSFGGLEIELKKFDILYPKADVVLWFKFDPLDNGVFKVEGTITIHCDDVTKPGSCNVTIDLGKTAKEIRPLINWDCLKNCAPQCISCGGDWQCWLGCAGGCIIQCL